MEKAIIGKKVGMTQIFDEAGKVIPVTWQKNNYPCNKRPCNRQHE